MQIEIKDIGSVVYGDSKRMISHWTRWLKTGDNGKIAILEKGNAYPLIFPTINNDYNRNYAEDVALLVGQCFGISRRHTEVGNFGSSMNILLLKIGSNGGDGVKRRANRIIMSDGLKSMELILPSMVKWMKQHSVAVNFWRLYVDIYFWNEKTQRRWASEFYRAR